MVFFLGGVCRGVVLGGGCGDVALQRLCNAGHCSFAAMLCIAFLLRCFACSLFCSRFFWKKDDEFGNCVYFRTKFIEDVNPLQVKMAKFKNKYRIESIRLKNWDYRWNSAYFITICTANRENYFGEVVNGKMVLNELGKLSEKYWLEIPDHFPYVQLGNFVVMPNHTHGILIIAQPINSWELSPYPDDPILPPDPTKNQQMSKISPKSGSISTIIRSYKSVVSKNIRLIEPNFKWLSRYHDIIIRDAMAYENIQKYILNNPKNYKKG